jgi:CDP-diacylglycerol--glycerol-3-phosphate 3-phosphatidyltransferase
MIPVFLAFAVEPPEPISELFSFAGADSTLRAFRVFLSEYGHIASGIVFSAAVATDALDGYIARKYDMITDFGIFFDPIADKLLVTAALVVLASRGAIGVWTPVIILSREFIITGLRLIAANKGIALAAGTSGKAKMIIQSAALSLLIFQNFKIPILVFVKAGSVLMYAALILTIVSGAEYIYKNRALFADRRRNGV